MVDETHYIEPSKYYLDPGHIYLSYEPVSIRTVVGSCVAVCLWDPFIKRGGMSHFMYPHTKDKSQATACYGNVATKTLIKLMIQAGAHPQNLQAQLFGGGCKDHFRENSPGWQNVLVARSILKKANIKIISEDVGGTMGRKVVFDTETGEAAVLKVHKVRSNDWLSE